MSATNDIVFIGDVHGDWTPLKRYSDIAAKGANLFQVGDFGIGFFSPQREFERLAELNKVLADNGNHLFAIRGNHDNPDWFPFSLSNVHLLQDGSHVIGGRTVVVFGGGTSIDRRHRVPKVSWWEGEVVDKTAIEQFTLPATTDIIVTHVAPIQTPLRILDPGVVHPETALVRAFMEHDKQLGQDLAVERSAMDILYNKVVKLDRPVHWVYGHYHAAGHGQLGSIKFQQLDINEARSI